MIIHRRDKGRSSASCLDQNVIRTKPKAECFGKGNGRGGQRANLDGDEKETPSFLGKRKIRKAPVR